MIAPGEAGNQLIAFEDRPLNFDAWDINIYYTDKPYPVDDVTSWRVVEEGPLRGGVEIVRRYDASTITQRLLIHTAVPRIDFPMRVDWRERQTLLKAAFPVSVNSPRATPPSTSALILIVLRSGSYVTVVPLARIRSTYASVVGGRPGAP